MKMTRDDLTWVVGRVMALILALAAMSAQNLAAMGIPASWQPKILLAAFVVGIVSGTMGNSTLPGKPKGEA